MKKQLGFIILTALVFVLFSSLVFATTITTLSDGSSEKNLTFGSAEDKLVYLKIPKNVSITSATMNLGGYSGTKYIFNDDQTSYSILGEFFYCPKELFFDKNWNYGEVCNPPSMGTAISLESPIIINIDYILTDISYIKEIVWNVSYRFQFDDEFSYFYCKNQTSNEFILLKTETKPPISYPEAEKLRQLITLISLDKSCFQNSPLQLKLILNTSNIPNKQGFYLVEEGISIGYDIYPSSPILDVGNDGDNQWFFSGQFKTSETIADFSSEINNYLSTCIADFNGDCLVPLKFHSDSAGTLEISNINVQYCTIACSSNLDCNDNNPCTTDICNNPGTCSASCSYTNNTNACGTKDCDYLDTTCRNYYDVNRYCSRGSCADATCNNYTDALTGTSCGACGTCSNGVCTGERPIVCYSDWGCNDYNPCTTDICNSRGTCSASCSYNNIPFCCGNGVCESNETYSNCCPDCCPAGKICQNITNVLTCAIPPSPSEWSSCVNNQQTRTNYKCDALTNYVCQAYTETKTCVIEAPPTVTPPSPAAPPSGGPSAVAPPTPPVEKIKEKISETTKELEQAKTNASEEVKINIEVSQNKSTLIVKEIESFENETGKRDIVYTLRWLVGMVAEQEKKDAEFLFQKALELKEVANSLKTVAESITNTNKEIVVQQAQNLESQAKELEKKAKEKRESAGGIISWLMRLFGITL